MRTTFIIDKNGNNIAPNAPIALNTDYGNNSTYDNNQISFEFYNTVSDAQNQANAVLNGVTGTLVMQARPTLNANWQTVAGGSIDLSTASIYSISNGGLPTVIQSLKFSSSNTAGCNYILVTLYRS